MTMISPGALSSTHAASSALKPALDVPVVAITIRSKRSFSIVCRSACRYVRPRSIRASTGTP
jgi:hypothetical protein